MDFFDFILWRGVVPLSVASWVAGILVVGLALSPQVRDWYLEQAQVHAEHLLDRIISATQVSVADQ